jgi:hypothetical protein
MPKLLDVSSNEASCNEALNVLRGSGYGIVYAPRVKTCAGVSIYETASSKTLRQHDHLAFHAQVVVKGADIGIGPWRCEGDAEPSRWSDRPLQFNNRELIGDTESRRLRKIPPGGHA